MSRKNKLESMAEKNVEAESKFEGIMAIKELLILLIVLILVLAHLMKVKILLYQQIHNNKTWI